MVLKLVTGERYVPTAEIAALLGLSLPATRTVMSRLRNRGLGIECVIGLGYRRDPSKDAPPGAMARTPKASKRGMGSPIDTFGGYLRDRRLRSGLSQVALASRAGVASSYTSRFETGERVPGRDIVATMAEAMGLSRPEADRLMVLAGYAPESIRRLDPARLEALLALIDTEAA